MKSKKPKIIAIGGTTASGKTSLSIKIAKEFNGEVINADSRQVYKHLNIGTAKEPIEERLEDGSVIIKGIRHHLIDFVEPTEIFNLARYQKLCFKTIQDILDRKKVPLLVGGTGLYIDSVVYNYDLSDQNIDKERREELKNKSIEELQNLLEELDSEIFESLNNSDRNNPHRLIRRIEKIKDEDTQETKNPSKYETLYLGLAVADKVLKSKIIERVNKMVKNGLIEENKRLRRMHPDFSRIIKKTIGYKEFDQYFSGEISEDQLKELIITHTNQYANRQRTWFNRNEDIVWISSHGEAVKKVSEFLS